MPAFPAPELRLAQRDQTARTSALVRRPTATVARDPGESILGSRKVSGLLMHTPRQPPEPSRPQPALPELPRPAGPPGGGLRCPPATGEPPDGPFHRVRLPKSVRDKLAYPTVCVYDSRPFASEKALFIAGKDGYHTYRIPALAVTTRGTVLAFCEGRKHSSSDRSDATVLRRSRASAVRNSGLEAARGVGDDDAGCLRGQTP